ncbi:hypothetical protein [Ileibacterium valens]|uniref:hypothetical protein n=1 Tax=Ileibacterium valens TaxID=1862668 RepID=UPI0024BAD308|nr:hypothetical protein [Ileibacterium valens]
MRYNTKIELVHIEPGNYDPKTGNYSEGIETSKTVWADVTSTGIEKMNLVYGRITQGSLTIRLQQIPVFKFEKIRINGVLYQVDTSKFYRSKATLYVSKVKI